MNHKRLDSMKKFLLPENGNFYKANLHCHSTYSDGAHTPEELKKMYVDHGYSVVAFTDHNLFACHNELTDENFVALNAFEINFCETNPDGSAMDFNLKRSTHLGVIAKDPSVTKHPVFTSLNFRINERAKALHTPDFYENEEAFVPVYSVESVNSAIKKAKDRGFYVIYNHPTWSLDSYEQYTAYEGFDAFEMFNYHNYVRGLPEYNPRVFDDLLRLGKKVFCVSTDDNHNSRLEDSFGGFTVIKADKLDYESIIKALEDGNFYASFGPEIKNLWYEDKKICVECSPCQRIQFNTAITLSHAVKAKDGELLTYAEFPVDPSYGYVRVTVVGDKGQKANTNAYFLDEIMNEEEENS